MKSKSGFPVFFGMLAIASWLCLLACGGGGGGGTPPLELYQGLKTQAVITDDNAVRFLSLFIGDAIAIPDLAGTSQPTAVALADLGPAAVGRSVSLARELVGGTIPGIVGGTMSYSGEIKNDGTGTVTVTFTQFNNGDGVTYNGRLILEILAVDPLNPDDIIHTIATLTLLTIQTQTDKVTVDGTIESAYDIPANTSTDRFDFDARDDNTAATFRLEDLVHTLTCDTLYQPGFCEELIAGKVYLDTEGYVNLSTRLPLEYDYPGQFNIDVPNAGGPVILAGAQQTFARITPLSISEVLVELDIDTVPGFERSDTYRWYELAGLVITWEKTFGALSDAEVALSAVETRDGGFVAAGWSNTNTSNMLDMMLVKTDAAGEHLWTRYLGGTGDDYAQSVRETMDGGLIVAGYTEDPRNIFTKRLAVYRLDSTGTLIWSNIFTGELESMALAIEPTADGGFILTGNIGSWSPGMIDLVGNGSEDLILLKLDQNGNVLWEKRFGGSYEDCGYSVIEVSGGGFLATGSSWSADDGWDVYLVRTDDAGNLLWESRFGGIMDQHGWDLVEDFQGHFVISGSTSTLTASSRPALLKADWEGSLLWTRTYDLLLMNSWASSVTLAGDSGYVATVNGNSFDVELFKTDQKGNLLWEKTFNWSWFLTMCTVTSVERTTDDGFVLAGSAWPDSGKDFYLIKTDSNGDR